MSPTCGRRTGWRPRSTRTPRPSAANRLLAVEAAGDRHRLPAAATFDARISVNPDNWYRKVAFVACSESDRRRAKRTRPSPPQSEDRRQNFAPITPDRERGGECRFISGRNGIRPGRDRIGDGLYAERPLQAVARWVMARHFHTSPVPRLLQTGSLDNVLPDFELARATGVNVYEPIGAAARRVAPLQRATAESTAGSRAGRGGDAAGRGGRGGGGA